MLTPSNTARPTLLEPTAELDVPRATVVDVWPPRRAVPLVGGVVALALAAWGETLAEAHDTTPLSLVLYLIAILLFTASAWALPARRQDVAVPALTVSAPSRWRAVIIMSVGTALAIGLNIWALLILREDLKSLWGTVLWLASLFVLLASGWLVRQEQGWAPRWGAGTGPQTARGRWLLAATALALFALAVAARLIALDQVPFGVNGDEGDRGALAIQILHGDNTASIFDMGWYWIPTIYFWLLAQVMKVLGVGYVQARVLSAVAGIFTAGAITWLAARHFGLRTGLLTGAIAATLAVLLQFSRFASEASITATLWTIAGGLLLEAARCGKWWAWTGAGLAGGFALYFYPTGKLWVVVAAGFCIYLFLHGLGGRRLAVLGGTALTALAVVMAVSPYLLNTLFVLKHPEVIYLRAQETSIFTGDNATRLYYYQPSWSIWQLLVAQVVHGVGILNQWGDAGGTWPTQRPILWGALAVLAILGLGWSCLRWRDPRFVLLAIWFWVGISGTITTIDTPGLQRMTTAVPLLALFPALVLDSLARRVEVLIGESADRVRRMASVVPATSWFLLRNAGQLILAIVALTFTWDQGHFYFVDYAKMDRWMYPTAEGRAVASQGTDTLVTTLGWQQHMVNAGWVRLLAPDTPRAGIPAPGSDLPLALPADKNLAFILFNEQAAYLPYLKELYPVGSTQVYTHPTEGKMFTMYRVEQQDRAVLQGAMAHPPGGTPQRVHMLGEPPPGWSTYPSSMRWTAGLRVSEYWNYSIRIGPGPAQLTVDGTTVLTAPVAGSTVSTTLSLARGDHYVEYDGTLQAQRQAAALEWASLPEPVENGLTPALDWRPVAESSLMSTQGAPVGLFGIATLEGRPSQQWIDRTIATCCLSTQLRADGHPYTATWTGILNAPSTGVYSMTLFTVGVTDLKLDGETVIHVDDPSETHTGGTVTLNQGRHTVELIYRVAEGPGGLEWAWTPPDGATSIVAPSVLSPRPGSGVGPPVPLDLLGRQEFQPVDSPLAIVK
jgi:hypothetical protein